MNESTKCGFGDGCPSVTELEKRVGLAERELRETGRRLSDGDKQFAVLNAKLNWLIAILSAIGTAVLGVAVKLLLE